MAGHLRPGKEKKGIQSKDVPAGLWREIGRGNKVKSSILLCDHGPRGEVTIRGLTEGEERSHDDVRGGTGGAERRPNPSADKEKYQRRQGAQRSKRKKEKRGRIERRYVGDLLQSVGGTGSGSLPGCQHDCIGKNSSKRSGGGVWGGGGGGG